MFDIHLTNDIVTELESNILAVYGKITAGDLAEIFIASLVIWDAEKYESQWRTAVERVVAGESKSALVVSYADPSIAEFLIWWLLYREGDSVYLQNQMLFFDRLKEPWYPGDLQRYVPDRRTVNESGIALSEWVVALQDFREWLHVKG